MNRLRNAAKVAALVVVSAAATPAFATQAVIDAKAIAQQTKITGEIAKNGSLLEQGLEQGQQMLDTVGDINSVDLSVLGNIGDLTNSANAALNSCGIGATIPSLSGFSIDLPNLPDFSCLQDSMSFVQEALYTSHTLGARFGLGSGGAGGAMQMTTADIEEAKDAGVWNDVLKEVGQNRENMQKNFVENGLATALTNAAETPKTQDSLSAAKSFAIGAKDYAAMIQLISTQQRQQTAELAKIRHIMAQLLGIIASNTMREIPIERLVSGGDSGGSNPFAALNLN